MVGKLHEMVVVIETPIELLSQVLAAIRGENDDYVIKVQGRGDVEHGKIHDTSSQLEDPLHDNEKEGTSFDDGLLKTVDCIGVSKETNIADDGHIDVEELLEKGKVEVPIFSSGPLKTVDCIGVLEGTNKDAVDGEAGPRVVWADLAAGDAYSDDEKTVKKRKNKKKKHDPGLAYNGEGGKGGSGTQPCRQWQQGSCRYGDTGAGE